MKNLESFLTDLTAISTKHGIGITGTPDLFVLTPEDNDREYYADNESRLHFDGPIAAPAPSGDTERSE